MDSSVGGLEYIHGDNAILRYDFDAKGTTLPELEKDHDFDTDILISLIRIRKNIQNLKWKHIWLLRKSSA